MKMATMGAFAVALASAALLPTAVVETAAAPAACESLTALTLPHTTIRSAQIVAPGAFTPPAGGRAGRPTPAIYATLPSFCRVAATLAPSSDSDIRMEVWLPTSGWNGDFEAVGNGGWAGSISYQALAQAVAAGYAGASTDTGHTGNTAAFAVGHPEKVIDMGYRSVHEMTLQAKALVDAFYGNAPKLSLWNGCSQGGRQGITEAQRYPADFDAVVAGAPAVNWIHLSGVRMAINLQVHATTESDIPPDKYPMVHAAVLAACDALDGVKDGVLENPSRCHFDPTVLACKGADGPTCLTKPQVETARALYAPIRNPTSGAVLSGPLLEPGSELGWSLLAGPEPINTALDAFRYVVFQDAGWDWRRFNPATDIERAEKMDRGVLNSAVVDLRPFFTRGGKLLMYHGWSDPQVAPSNSIGYFTAVVRATGQDVVGRSIQLYMIPGMNHCAGGPGTDTFDKMGTLKRWVASGSAPASIVASHLTAGTIDRTRPICPYGQAAEWNGRGSTDEAANFACLAAPRN